jgi:glycosyltransferase involved in cell wall biosynthesis
MGLDIMKASIIIPVYNGQQTIRKAIKSVLKQNLSKKYFEIIVVNDGSTDKTLDILKEYKNKIKIVNQKKQGAIKAANAGFKKARAKYLIKLDADDCFEPDILSRMAKILDAKREIDFVYCDYYERTIKGKVKVVSTESNIFNTVAAGIMFRRARFENEGFYREDIFFAEYDLLLKTLGRWNGHHIKAPLFWYNRSRESLTGNKQQLKKGLFELKRIYPKKILQIKKIRGY